MTSLARLASWATSSHTARSSPGSSDPAASQRRPALALAMIAVRGWLTSCAIEAVSWPRAVSRAAWESSACARRSASSARRRSVTSTWTPTTRTGRPSASRCAIPRACSQWTLPSGQMTRNSTDRSPATSVRCNSSWTRARSSGWTRWSHASELQSYPPGEESYIAARSSCGPVTSGFGNQSKAATFPASCARASRSWLSRRDSSIRRRSSKRAARSSNGSEIPIRKICRDSTFSCGDRVVKGPRPANAFDRDRRAIARRAKQVPAGPNLTAAHNRNGSGA